MAAVGTSIRFVRRSDSPACCAWTRFPRRSGRRCSRRFGDGGDRDLLQVPAPRRHGGLQRLHVADPPERSGRAVGGGSGRPVPKRGPRLPAARPAVLDGRGVVRGRAGRRDRRAAFEGRGGPRPDPPARRRVGRGGSRGVHAQVRRSSARARTRRRSTDPGLGGGRSGGRPGGTRAARLLRRKDRRGGRRTGRVPPRARGTVPLARRASRARREEGVTVAHISRGFRGRRGKERRDAQLPPGQYWVEDFPVLSAGPTPHTPLDQWTFSIVGEVAEPTTWSWGGGVVFGDVPAGAR